MVSVLEKGLALIYRTISLHDGRQNELPSSDRHVIQAALTERPPNRAGVNSISSGKFLHRQGAACGSSTGSLWLDF